MSKKCVIALLLLVVAATAAGCGGGGSGGAAASTPTPEAVEGWALIPINVAESGGGVRIEFAARNDSGGWSMMEATVEEGDSLDLSGGGACSTVQVSTGGHYLPPGFQMRGYLNKQGEVQTLYVECDAGDVSGSTLTIPYRFILGDYDYYAKGESEYKGELEVDLSQVASDLTYPAASSTLEVDVQPLHDPIIALNKCELTLVDATRTDEGFTFNWTIYNPGEYGTLVHIGRPPVLGDDGIVYSAWISPDLVEVPIAGSEETVEVETQSPVPPDVGAPYLLVSVEEKRERLFTGHLLDLSGVE